MYQQMNALPENDLEAGCGRDAGFMRREASFRLPATASSVPVARRFIRTVALSWGLDGEMRDNAELVVSELTGNAVRHGRCDLDVTLALGSGGRLQVTVTDSGGDPPDSETPMDDDEGGRGLYIVHALAEQVLITRDLRRHQVCVSF
ncbi:ATP-binding protein [Streptomyces sp. NPDC090073]|uniref:ATP-binding protein n=1 Tax=Streptomyces sp. NPDC090073 TaxID=3365936 RepID=UPI0037FB0CA8